MTVSAANRRAIRKYDSEHYDMIRARVKKEIAKEFKEACERNGDSQAGIINKAILAYLGRTE